MRTIPALIVCLGSGAASAELVETRGDARDIESGALLYTEHHLMQLENGKPRERLVMYRCPDGRAFGRKTVVYDAAMPAAPAFAMRDARLDYREGARRDGDGLFVWSAFGANGEPAGERVDETPDLAIDIGFDAHLRKHWQALQAGDTVPVDFLVPDRGRTYVFNIVKLREERVDDAVASVFRLRLRGLLGWLVPDMEVSYRNSDRRLMRFKGSTNIRVAGDDLISARIDYPVAAERASPDRAAWQAMHDAPLVACALGVP